MTFQDRISQVKLFHTPLALQELQDIADRLKHGAVAIFPTETVYGIGTLWENNLGRERIYELKHRPQNKLLQMLASDLDQAEQAGVIVTEALKRIGERFWPGPLTLVVPSVDGDTIGLRIPDHPLLLELLKRIGSPLAATSANLSGQPAGLTAMEALSQLQGSPDLAIEGDLTSTTAGASSTVAALSEGKITLLRQGPITLEHLEECLD